MQYHSQFTLPIPCILYTMLGFSRLLISYIWWVGKCEVEYPVISLYILVFTFCSYLLSILWVVCLFLICRLPLYVLIFYCYKYSKCLLPLYGLSFNFVHRINLLILSLMVCYSFFLHYFRNPFQSGNNYSLLHSLLKVLVFLIFSPLINLEFTFVFWHGVGYWHVFYI